MAIATMRLSPGI